MSRPVPQCDVTGFMTRTGRSAAILLPHRWSMGNYGSELRLDPISGSAVFGASSSYNEFPPSAHYQYLTRPVSTCTKSEAR